MTRLKILIVRNEDERMKNSCAWIDGKNKIVVELAELLTRPSTDPIIESEQHLLAIESIDWNGKEATIKLEEDVPLEHPLNLIWQEIEVPIYARNVVQTGFFEEQYDASHVQLGAMYSREKTSFSIWAPTASQMVLVLKGKQIRMMKDATGVWHGTVFGDCHLARYYFLGTINGQERQINDPYAKSLTANSQEGVVLDLQKTDPVGFRTILYPYVSRADAIIYELHVRDATSALESGVNEAYRGRFLGLTELNTKNPAGYSTGLSYLGELGCTHVELLPIQDFARVDELDAENGYNWGYDPLYYFTPEGSFTTNADDPVIRVQECKQMIHALHQKGLSVILDVVFNHVYDYQDSMFENCLPGYFFRTLNGQLSNATGTGNDLATERVMVRKFILDCIDYWLSEYRVDGFRFDLMGAIDIETMQAIRRRCELEDRPILLIGEGWELDTALLPSQKSSIAQAHQLENIGFFNDRFRDAVKGKLFDHQDCGFVNGNGQYMEQFPQLVAGSCQVRFGDPPFLDPLQSVNYVECHDNHTLWDRLALTNKAATEKEKKQMHQLATGLTLLSQGIPFLHAGQEFFRTKFGDENSYLSGDAINQLDWSQRGREENNVQWVRRLIQVRKHSRLLRLASAEEIGHRLHIIHAPNPVFGFLLAGDEEDLVIFANPTNKMMQIEMPALGRWEKSVSNYTHAVSEISCLIDSQIKIAPYELVIFRKQRG